MITFEFFIALLTFPLYLGTVLNFIQKPPLVFSLATHLTQNDTSFIVISREVFHEHLFPFALNLTNSSVDGCFLQPFPSSLEFLVSLPVSIPDFNVSSDQSFSSFSFPDPSSSPYQPSSSPFSPSQPVVSSVPSPIPDIPPSFIQKSTRPRTTPWYPQDFHCQ